MTEKKPMRAELVDDYRIKCQLLLEEVIDAEEAAKLAAAEIAELRAERDRLKAALGDVMEWIDNWSPPFTQDGEWAETELKARKALGDAS